MKLKEKYILDYKMQLITKYNYYTRKVFLFFKFNIVTYDYDNTI